MDPEVDTASPDERDRRRRRLQGWLFVALWVAQAALLLGAYRPEHDWGDDFAAYILQAKAWVEDRPMAEAGYLYSPHVGPRAYPPGLPLILAPLYARYGADVGLFKLQLLAIHLLAVALLIPLFARELRPYFALAAWASFCFSPFVLSSAARVMSDVPLLAACAALWALLGRPRHQAVGPAELTALALLGALATSLRVMGALLAVAFLAADLVRRRRISRQAAAVSLGTLLALGLGQLPAFRGQEGPLAHASAFWPGVVALNLPYYLVGEISAVWPGPRWTVGTFEVPWLWVVGAPLAAWGFVRRAARSDLWLESFFVLVWATVMLLSFRADARYLLPVLPLLCLYGGLGFTDVLARLRRVVGSRVTHGAALGAGALLAWIYAGSARTIADPWPGDYHPDGATAVELLDFVRRGTPLDSTLVFFKPRALVLFTGRRAVAFPPHQSTAAAFSFLQETSADFMIAAQFGRERDDQHLADACQDTFPLVFANADYRLFRIEPAQLAACRAQYTAAAGGAGSAS